MVFFLYIPPQITNDIPHFSSYFQFDCTDYNTLAKLATIEVVLVFYHMCTYSFSRYNIIKVPTYRKLVLAEHENSLIFTLGGLVVFHFEIFFLVRASAGIMGFFPFEIHPVQRPHRPPPSPHIFDKNRIQVEKRSLYNK